MCLWGRGGGAAQKAPARAAGAGPDSRMFSGRREPRLGGNLGA